jgi:hypothetical protein
MTQVLYAHMNNKTKKKKKRNSFSKSISHLQVWREMVLKFLSFSSKFHSLHLSSKNLVIKWVGGRLKKKKKIKETYRQFSFSRALWIIYCLRFFKSTILFFISWKYSVYPETGQFLGLHWLPP